MADQQPERRRAARREILETFHVFLAIPRAGSRKIYIKDLSEHGMAFYSETEDAFEPGARLDCFFHINPALKLPLSIKVTHVTQEDARSRVGCEIDDQPSQAHKAYVSFLRLLDDLAAFLI